MKSYLLNTLSIFATAIILLSSCKKSKPNQPPEPTPPAYDIYAAGREQYIAKYWKNGVPTTLGKSGSSSDATAMAIAGNYIHIAGNEMNASGKYVAKYWKNGIATSLTDGTRDAFANDLFLNGNDVYIAGLELSP